MSAIVVTDLRKDYGPLAAVDGLSFDVREGECFCVLGPNGAGKTTTVEILEGHRDRTGGEVEVLGFDPGSSGREFRERIGIVLQEAGVDDEFTVRELVTLYRGMYPRRRDVDELIELVGLADKAEARVKTLSGGQRRRLDLALGLVGDPELLFLDEPTTGFDPSARRKAWKLVDNLKELGKTIVLTTHYMDEAQHLADRLAIIAKGRMIAMGTPDELSEQHSDDALISFRLPAGVTAGDLPALGSVQVDGPQVTTRTRTATATLTTLTRWATDRGVELESLRLAQPTLEDVYLRLIGGAGDG
ncbi:MAG: ABC transporter ATP-binding protein [Actinobacteria bacterium]|nr:ABC transporter ATP-binding protein [Actinomycetota bacterium]